MTKQTITAAGLTLALSLGATAVFAQAINGSNLTLSGHITQNGFGPNFFDAGNNIFSGRACIGPACDGTEPFEQGPLRLKWSEPDILFEDSSTTGGISSNDWRLVINDVSTTKFAVQDIDGDTIPFTIEGGVPTNTLVLETSGEVGMGTASPLTQLHIVDGDSPTVRLQQDGSEAMPQQTWDIGGNETSFFIRDVSGSNQMPFRILPGADTGSFLITGNGDIGLGTAAPEEKLHIRTTANNTDAFALFDAAGTGSDSAFRLRQNGTVPSTWEFRNQQDSGRLNVGLAGGNTPFKIDNAANNNLMRLGRNGLPGEVNITGTLVVNNTQLNVPDYVFADDYPLRPLAEVQAFIKENSHLPDVPSEAEIRANGVDMTEMQMTLLKKVEELTLYTLEQDAVIATLTEKAAQSDTQAAIIAALAERLAVLEAAR
ncbi:hypothetical protein A8B82_12075 [Sulfitobacter sp. EhC04]|uniref:hypothetical protein n=1 Tax=Sulfitobacter sp. EhC04 TaxID=1849168 RepID=UPI0007F4BA76|nr:hypothetical protein [Sulfitobacter sp. EhC04]OAN77646.1 hypothetical protein A8B82_12075 [Sulfitobacter sp. EhC04]